MAHVHISRKSQEDLCLFFSAHCSLICLHLEGIPKWSNPPIKTGQGSFIIGADFQVHLSDRRPAKTDYQYKGITSVAVDMISALANVSRVTSMTMMVFGHHCHDCDHPCYG